MIRLNRLRWMMSIASAEKYAEQHPTLNEGWFWFPHGVKGLRRWLWKHDLLVGKPMPWRAEDPVSYVDVRLSEKGHAALKTAIAEYEQKRGGLK